MAVTLRLVLAPDRQFLLTGPDAIIGRADHGDIVVPHETVSGRHGIFRANAIGYTYTDLGSRNGSAIQKGGEGEIVPLAPGDVVQVDAGDLLLLGSIDTPARIAVEAARAPYEPGRSLARTVVASAPLVDLLQRPSTDMVSLAARAIAAETPDELAEAAHRFLTASIEAEAYAVHIAGGAFQVSLGDPVPKDLESISLKQREVVRLSGDNEAAVAPLIARGTWHGYLAVWSKEKGIGPSDLLDVAAPLVALACAALTVRTEQAAALLAMDSEGRDDPIGSAPAFLDALDLAKRLAHSDVALLLIGETGSGKDLFARAVHEQSARVSGPFVAINCGAIPVSLLESELFGHVQGAFTGAGRDHQGVFEQAHGGTLFLDELGEMPLAVQAGILRAIENGEIRRVGDTRARIVDVRVVSATHRDLGKMVEAGTFRADLMYRLDAAKIRIPPLRDRGDDVVLLAHHLLAREARKAKKRVLGFSPEALLSLLAYPFPGNVRELRNEVARAVALTQADAHVSPTAFSEKIAGLPSVPARGPGGALTLKQSVEMAERHAVEIAMARNKGNLTQTAKELGLSRAGFYKLLVRLGLRQGADAE